MTAPSLGNAKDPNSSQPVSPDASLDSVLADFHSLDSEFIKFEVSAVGCDAEATATLPDIAFHCMC